MNEWSTMKKLIWLKRTALGGIPFVWKTESGEAPLTLEGALAKRIKSLTQYGLCTQASTPTPSNPVDIVCNNGTICSYPTVGSSTQASTPTPTDPVPIVSFDKGGMVLRALGDIKDSYDKATHTITRRVGVVVFDGTEAWNKIAGQNIYYTQSADYLYCNPPIAGMSTHYVGSSASNANMPSGSIKCTYTADQQGAISIKHTSSMSSDEFKEYLASQYASDTPVICLYPLSTPTTEAWSGEDWYVDGTPESISITASGAENQTASVESLLSVDSDADEQEIIHGAIKRKCAVRVLDGTEDWSLAGTGVFSFQLGEANGTAWRKEAISTHYVGTDATTATMPSDSIKCATNAAGTVYSLYIKPSAYSSSSANTFKAYVAAQYAAGTPIIVVYPLVEETTESVTPQPLNTTEGDNTISVSANVSPISLKAEYAGVSV